jgi:hypothetical protein
VSDRVKELAERQARLQERCAAQRASIASEVASIEARFGRVDRIAGLVRAALLNPVVIGGAIVALLTVGRLRGTRLIGRLYLLGTAARQLVQTVRLFQGLVAKPSPSVRRGQL